MAVFFFIKFVIAHCILFKAVGVPRRLWLELRASLKYNWVRRQRARVYWSVTSATSKYMHYLGKPSEISRRKILLCIYQVRTMRVRNLAFLHDIRPIYDRAEWQIFWLHIHTELELYLSVTKTFTEFSFSQTLPSWHIMDTVLFAFSSLILVSKELDPSQALCMCLQSQH
jgi:hypothetical protein